MSEIVELLIRILMHYRPEPLAPNLGDCSDG
jgi:hypothetical protein